MDFGASTSVFEARLCHLIFISLESNGLFQKKSTPPRRMGFWKFSREGGSKTPEIQAGGGVDLKKVFCRGHFDR